LKNQGGNKSITKQTDRTSGAAEWTQLTFHCHEIEKSLIK